MRAKLERLKRKVGKIDWAIVDYLQIMHGAAGHYGSREQEIADIARSLQATSKALKIPVTALCQLNRKVEERADKRPGLPDLRESGEIEQAADVIAFIYRENWYTTDKKNEPGVAEIKIDKQRNGPPGFVELTFIPRYARFENLAHQEGE
jgi:replicative DNA helicase